MTTATPYSPPPRSPLRRADAAPGRTSSWRTLADGVRALTTSDGWRRYLRAMSTLRTYSTGNSRMSQSRECTCNTLQIVVLVTNHVTLPAVNQAGPASPNSRGFRRAPRRGLDGACLACRRRITPTLPLGSITQ